jgi:hypothetical protein
MAQVGNFSPIQLYSSSTPGNAPAVGNLVNSTLGSELAINIADGKLFYKDSANAIQVIAWKTTPTTAGGTGLTSYSAGDMVYWASGTTFTKLGIGAANYIMTSSGSAPQWSASIGPAQGGTGITSYAVGDLIYASGTTTLSKLADVATGNALISGGVATAPSWGKIGLTTHVSGTLPTANGGTGLTSFTANAILYSSSTSALTTNSDLAYNGTNLTISSGNVVINSIGANDAGINGTAGGSFRFAITRQDAVQTASLYINSFGGIGFSSGLSSGGTPGSAPKMFLFNSGGLSLGNTTDPGATNLSVTGTNTVGGNSILHGEVGVGFDATGGTPSIKLGPGNGGHPAFVWYPYNKVSGPNTNYTNVYFNGDSNTFQIINTSNGVYLANNGTSWASLSDETRKDIIEPITNALTKLSKIRSVIGKYKTDSADVRRSFFLAQDFEKVMPEAVTKSSDNQGEFLGLQYQDALPLLAAAINELREKFDAYVASHP